VVEKWIMPEVSLDGICPDLHKADQKDDDRECDIHQGEAATRPIQGFAPI
jgi:hypothetical protein